MYRSTRDLSIGVNDSQFHAMWLGIEPFLSFRALFAKLANARRDVITPVGGWVVGDLITQTGSK